MFHISCSEHNQEPVSHAQIKENLIGMNKIVLQNESKKIDDYIYTRNLKMKTSETGLRYFLNHKTSAEPKHFQGEQVYVTYTLKTLEGETCYSFTEKNPFSFTIGRAETIKGIEEAVMMMNTGDEAILIIPSHLAYGKLGDDKKIPRDAALVCDMRLITKKITP
jgi:FKBP-type peptidyl-prolyl cis-trans isomerase